MAKFLGNLLGISFFLVVGIFFFNAVMKMPVVELSPEGECLRVLNEDGKNIPKGCHLVKMGKIKAEHRYVAR